MQHLKRDLRILKLKILLRRHLDLILNGLGVLLGLVLGFIVRTHTPTPLTLFWIGLPGGLYLRFLTMMIVPFAVSSITSGVAELDLRKGKRFGIVLILLLFINNMLSIVMGLSFVSFIFPTEPNTNGTSLHSGGDYSAVFTTILRNLIPDNLIATSFQKVSLHPGPVNHNSSIDNTHYDVPENYDNTPNMIGLVTLSIIFGITFGMMKEKAKPLIILCRVVSMVTLYILSKLAWVLPICTVSLTASAIGGIPDLGYTFLHIGLLIGLLAGTVFLHQLVVLPIFVFLGSRRNPFAIVYHGWRAWVLSFATGSSLLTAPEMFKACDKLMIPLAQAELGVALGLATNIAGSAIYVSLATIFVAHLEGLYVTVMQHVMLGILILTTLVGLSSGNNGAFAGLIIVMASLNIKSTNIGLLLAIEFIVDRIRTTSNVMAIMTCIYSAHQFSARAARAAREREEKYSERTRIVRRSSSV